MGVDKAMNYSMGGVNTRRFYYNRATCLVFVANNNSPDVSTN